MNYRAVELRGIRSFSVLMWNAERKPRVCADFRMGLAGCLKKKFTPFL
jgi:hypothetical protein